MGFFRSLLEDAGVISKVFDSNGVCNQSDFVSKNFAYVFYWPDKTITFNAAMRVTGPNAGCGYKLHFNDITSAKIINDGGGSCWKTLRVKTKQGSFSLYILNRDPLFLDIFDKFF